jgi:hypothetical protein
MLPPIFAVYNSGTQSFQLFQPDMILNNVVGIKTWSRPVKSCWKVYNTEKRKAMLPWLYGEQWYVIPTLQLDEPIIHTVRIYKRAYCYWYLNHMIVWADIIPPKQLDQHHIWSHYPHIPILEFQSNIIYPSYQTEIVPNWYRCGPQTIYEESLKGNTMLTLYLQPSVSPLRIRTPLPTLEEEEEAESDSDSNSDSESKPSKPEDTSIKLTIYEKVHYCITIVVIGYILYTNCFSKALV